MIQFRSILFGGVLVLVLGGISFAQDFTPRVGIAGNISVNLPVLGLRTWFTQAPQFGVNIVYHRHARIEVEYEYHHARFDGGSLGGCRVYVGAYRYHRSSVLQKSQRASPKCVFTAFWSTASSFLASNSTTKRLGLISHSGAAYVSLSYY